MSLNGTWPVPSMVTKQTSPDESDNTMKRLKTRQKCARPSAERRLAFCCPKWTQIWKRMCFPSSNQTQRTLHPNMSDSPACTKLMSQGCRKILLPRKRKCPPFKPTLSVSRTLTVIGAWSADSEVVVFLCYGRFRSEARLQQWEHCETWFHNSRQIQHPKKKNSDDTQISRPDLRFASRKTHPKLQGGAQLRLQKLHQFHLLVFIMTTFPFILCWCKRSRVSKTCNRGASRLGEAWAVKGQSGLMETRN